VAVLCQAISVKINHCDAYCYFEYFSPTDWVFPIKYSFADLEESNSAIKKAGPPPNPCALNETLMVLDGQQRGNITLSIVNNLPESVEEISSLSIEDGTSKNKTVGRFEIRDSTKTKDILAIFDSYKEGENEEIILSEASIITESNKLSDDVSTQKGFFGIVKRFFTRLNPFSRSLIST